MFINRAKLELEKERELLMSKSLPGGDGSFNEDSNNSNEQNDGESDSDSDTESDDKSKLNCNMWLVALIIPCHFSSSLNIFKNWETSTGRFLKVYCIYIFVGWSEHLNTWWGFLVDRTYIRYGDKLYSVWWKCYVAKIQVEE